LKATLATIQEPVKVQRFNVPLPFHIYAEGAARAAVCAKVMGKEEEMADLLFHEPLEPDVWFKHAKTLGLDEATFRACLDSDATNATLADHIDLFKSTGARGIPLTFIGRETLNGAPDPAMVRETFRKALAPEPRRISGWVFLTLIVGLVVAIVLIFRKKGDAALPSTSAR
jgi:predicted DsbA family dithiol-disulfide isomerase